MTLEEEIRIKETMARKEGREEGLKEGRLQTARLLKENGVEETIIITCTGLTAEEVAAL